MHNQMREYITVFKEPSRMSYSVNWSRLHGNHPDQKAFAVECWSLGVSSKLDEIKTREIGEFERINPLTYLNETEAQHLIDSLYTAGLRPSDSTDNSNVIKRMDNHLQDMRTIAFNRLSIEKEK